MTTLIDCMAAMPAAGAMRPSAPITATEKAKNRPAISAAPSAAANSMTRSRLMAFPLTLRIAKSAIALPGSARLPCVRA